ncbi:hypothetical protein PENTCL1PPCAC_24584 [Pristionchus entomophagus]|uniref:Uncharacterized protein n=1 Tax=Pristionchus entomophagus TaxID=358040 RepID=A0AAV5U697_9BILA|nr:hypothetical protein PENTCL1PPCAC_24584 [Pristionchus entomophagus]
MVHRSKQHLKNKFSEGFSLTMKFATIQQAEESQEFICEILPKAKLITALRPSTVSPPISLQ